MRNFWNIVFFLGLALSGCTFEDTTFILLQPTVSDALQVSSTSFIARWHTLPGADSYQIDVSDNSSFETILPQYRALEISDTSLLVSGLSPNTDYFYRVRSLLDKTESDYSDYTQIKTLPIEAPVALAAEQVQGTNFRAAWNPSLGATKYLVSVSTDSDLKTMLANYNLFETTDLFLDVEALEPNKKYYYQIRAVSPNSTSVPSNTISLTTNELGSVLVADASEVSKTSFIANWLPLEGAKTYLLTVARDEEFTEILPGYQDKEVDALFFTLTNLDANTTYFYKVRAKNGDFTSNFSTVSVLKTLSLLSPTATNPSNVELTSFVMNWVSDETFVNVFYVDVATDAKFEHMLPDYTNKAVIGNSLEAIRLLPGTSYYYRVRGGGLNSVSENSNVMSVSTQTLDAPVVLPYTDRRAFLATVSWEANPLATSYLVSLAYDKEFTQLIEGYDELELASTQLQVRTSEYDKTLYMRVKAKHLDFVSNYSDVQQIDPAFSASCRVDKFEYRTSSLTITYDEMLRCSTVFYDYNYGSFYDEKNTFYYEGSERLPYKIESEDKTLELTYENGQVKTVTETLGGEFNYYAVWEYDENRRPVTVIYYDDTNKTTESNTITLNYDSNDNIIEVNSLISSMNAVYNYDDKLSPYALIPYPGFLVATKPYGQRFKIPNKHNITYVKTEVEEEVFSYEYESRDLSIKSNGFYFTTYIFSGCDEK